MPYQKELATIDYVKGNSDAHFQHIDRRFDVVDNNFLAIDKRFEAVDRKFINIDNRFDEIEEKIESLKETVVFTFDTLKSLDNKFTTLLEVLKVNIK